MSKAQYLNCILLGLNFLICLMYLYEGTYLKGLQFFGGSIICLAILLMK